MQEEYQINCYLMYRVTLSEMMPSLYLLLYSVVEASMML